MSTTVQVEMEIIVPDEVASCRVGAFVESLLAQAVIDAGCRPVGMWTGETSHNPDDRLTELVTQQRNSSAREGVRPGPLDIQVVFDDDDDEEDGLETRRTFTYNAMPLLSYNTTNTSYTSNTGALLESLIQAQESWREGLNVDADEPTEEPEREPCEDCNGVGWFTLRSRVDGYMRILRCRECGQYASDVHAAGTLSPGGIRFEPPEAGADSVPIIPERDVPDW